MSPVYQGHRLSLDGLRGFAIIFVLIEHSFHQILPFGYLGVDIFFVLSGYVVTLSLLRNSSDGKSFSINGFFVRRFKRLMPALLFTVIIFSFIFLFFSYPFSIETKISLQTGVASLFGFSNIFLFFKNQDYFSILSSHNLFLHTWSLGVEEQFYLLFALMFLFVRSKKYLLYLVLTLAFLSYSLQIHYLMLPEAYNSAFYLPFSRFWQLLLGSYAALSLKTFSPFLKYFNHTFLNLLSFFCFLGLIYGVFTGYNDHLWVTYTLISINVFILILLLERNSYITPIFQHPAILFLGIRSYSIYLFHWPLLVISSWIFVRSTLLSAICILLAVLLSTFTYKYIENPIRRSTYLGPSKYISLIYLAVSSFASICLYSFFLFNETIFLGEFRDIRKSKSFLLLPQRASAPHINNTSISRINCFKRFSFTNDIDINSVDIDNCYLPPLAGDRTIYLYGDSFAAHLTPLLEKLHFDNGFGVEILTRARCTFPPRYDNIADPCYRFYLQRKQRLLLTANSGDVLLLATSAREPSGRYTEFYMSSLRSLLSTLETMDVLVVYQVPLPRFPQTFDPVCTYPNQWFQVKRSSHCLSPSFVNRKSEIKRLSTLNSQLKLLQSQFSNFYLLNSFDYLCPPFREYCSTNSQYARLYRDGIHLSEYASQSLYSSLFQILQTSSPHYSSHR